MFTNHLLQNVNENLFQFSTEQLPGRVLLNTEREKEMIGVSERMSHDLPDESLRVVDRHGGRSEDIEKKRRSRNLLPALDALPTNLCLR